MTKIFFIVIAMLSNGDFNNTDLYVIQNPNFNSVKECVRFVQINNLNLIAKAGTEYPNRGIDNIYCVPEEQLKVLISGTQA